MWIAQEKCRRQRKAVEKGAITQIARSAKLELRKKRRFTNIRAPAIGGKIVSKSGKLSVAHAINQKFFGLSALGNPRNHELKNGILRVCRSYGSRQIGFVKKMETNIGLCQARKQRKQYDKKLHRRILRGGEYFSFIAWRQLKLMDRPSSRIASRHLAATATSGSTRSKISNVINGMTAVRANPIYGIWGQFAGKGAQKHLKKKPLPAEKKLPPFSGVKAMLPSLVSFTRLVFSLSVGASLLLSCTHSARNLSSLNSEDGPDYSHAVGNAFKVVSETPLHVVPTSFTSAVAGQTFDQNHPLVLSPGDAFVLKGADGNLMHIEFGYDEIIAGTVDARAFPPGSLLMIPRSDNLTDAALPDDGSSDENSFLEDASYHRAVVRRSGHSGGSNCALTPHRPGCCLAAVKYWLRDAHLIRPDLSNFPGVYGMYATQNLPSSFHSVGCQAGDHPQRAMVCSYRSTFNPTAGHVEVYDGAGWYFGLGHLSLRKDGHHTCIDCKVPR